MILHSYYSFIILIAKIDNNSELSKFSIRKALRRDRRDSKKPTPMISVTSRTDPVISRE